MCGRGSFARLHERCTPPCSTPQALSCRSPGSAEASVSAQSLYNTNKKKETRANWPQNPLNTPSPGSLRDTPPCPKAVPGSWLALFLVNRRW